MNVPPALQSKRTYWIVTAIMLLFMAAGALFDVAKSADAVKLITELGYPVYFVRLVGVMKLLAVAAIAVRGFPRLKQWAYAGLVFDTGGAVFSHLSSNSTATKWLPALFALILIGASYGLYSTAVDPHRPRPA